MQKKVQVTERVKVILNDPLFKDNHRTDTKFFTRDRKLSFVLLILIILQKSLKSLQLVLNEFFVKLSVPSVIVTASAFTQARAKLSHTAFIELNQKAVAETYYRDNDYKTWRGFRVLSVDGSKIILPNEDEIRKYFGVIRIADQDGNVGGEYPAALASVLYDVLNNIALDALLSHAKAYEVNLAAEHLGFVKENDLLLFDRNYPSYLFLASLIQQNIDFLGRCSRSSFKEARMMFESGAEESKIAVLRPHHTKEKEIRALGLPEEIKVRFVRAVLDNGEVEVLVTSLTDESLYPTNDFKELYNLRWGIETFYGTVKGRLDLENFTGKSVEAVRQDFYSTVFITGLESILTQDARESLSAKSSDNRCPQTVNKAVSFNTVKNYVIELFYKEQDTQVLSDKLTRLFMMNPICARERKVPRKKSRPGKILNYYRRIRKICF
jgi:hypothetical protein